MLWRRLLPRRHRPRPKSRRNRSAPRRRRRGSSRRRCRLPPRRPSRKHRSPRRRPSRRGRTCRRRRASFLRQFACASRSLAGPRSRRDRWRLRSVLRSRSHAWCSRLQPRRRNRPRPRVHARAHRVDVPADRVHRVRRIRRRHGPRRQACWADLVRCRRSRSARRRRSHLVPACRSGRAHHRHVRHSASSSARGNGQSPPAASVRPRPQPRPLRRRRQSPGRSRLPRG